MQRLALSDKPVRGGGTAAAPDLQLLVCVKHAPTITLTAAAAAAAAAAAGAAV
jgi:hypothetical protein